MTDRYDDDDDDDGDERERESENESKSERKRERATQSQDLNAGYLSLVHYSIPGEKPGIDDNQFY